LTELRTGERKISITAVSGISQTLQRGSFIWIKLVPPTVVNLIHDSSELSLLRLVWPAVRGLWIAIPAAWLQVTSAMYDWVLIGMYT